MTITEEGYAIIETDTHIGKWVRESQRLDHDATIGEYIVPLLKPDWWIIDAGANIGTHTVRYAMAVPEGRVLAFEPNPQAWECLTHNCRNYKNIECYSMAVSCDNSTAKLLKDENAGASYLTSGNDVDCISIDSLAGAGELDRLDFFKLDIEGYELFALKGAEQTIRRCQPTILVEMNAGTLARNGVKYYDILEFLSGVGYKWDSFPQTGLSLLNEPQYDLLARPI